MRATDVTIDLDKILLELGTGKFQRKNYILLTIPVIASALYTISYVFTAGNPDYRCLIPECETSSNTTYEPDWLENAVPYKNEKPRKCERYQFVDTYSPEDQICPKDMFNMSNVITCTDFVFQSQHVTIVNDFDIYCEDNLWKLTLPGTLHNVGQFISMPLTGIFSDMLGRRSAMTWGLLMSAIVGLIRSFSPSYTWFVILEFLDPSFGAAAYASAFILGTELVSPSKRVLMGTIICASYAVGEAIIGIVAWLAMSWRTLLQITYAPGLLIVLYFWITPESIRWLISKGRFDEVEAIILKAAKTNGVVLSEKVITSLEANKTAHAAAGCDANGTRVAAGDKYPITAVLKSWPLLFRLANCSICWITCVFVFYGLSLNSVEIAGNIYMNFIAVSLIEIPGYFFSYICLNRYGRRISLCGSFLVSGCACVGFIFVPNDIFPLKLSLFLLGKCAITMAFAIVYVYTAELFPTPLRQTLMGFCSMIGRIGAIVAPQMPFLASIWVSLPILLFGLMALLSGFLVLVFPETLNTKLPDTVEEAVNIGKTEKTDC